MSGPGSWDSRDLLITFLPIQPRMPFSEGHTVDVH